MTEHYTKKLSNSDILIEEKECTLIIKIPGKLTWFFLLMMTLTILPTCVALLVLFSTNNDSVTEPVKWISLSNFIICCWFAFLTMPRKEIISFGPDEMSVTGGYRVITPRSISFNDIKGFILKPVGLKGFLLKKFIYKRFLLNKRIRLLCVENFTHKNMDTDFSNKNVSVNRETKLVFTILFSVLNLIIVFFDEFFHIMPLIVGKEWGANLVLGLQAKQNELLWLNNILTKHYEYLLKFNNKLCN